MLAPTGRFLWVRYSQHGHTCNSRTSPCKHLMNHACCLSTSSSSLDRSPLSSPKHDPAPRRSPQLPPLTVHHIVNTAMAVSPFRSRPRFPYRRYAPSSTHRPQADDPPNTHLHPGVHAIFIYPPRSSPPPGPPFTRNHITRRQDRLHTTHNTQLLNNDPNPTLPNPNTASTPLATNVSPRRPSNLHPLQETRPHPRQSALQEPPAPARHQELFPLRRPEAREEMVSAEQALKRWAAQGIVR
jgi:hypothetical protein